MQALVFLGDGGGAVEDVDDDVLAIEDGHLFDPIERKPAGADARGVGEVDAKAALGLNGPRLVGAHAHGSAGLAVDGVEEGGLAGLAKAGDRDPGRHFEFAAHAFENLVHRAIEDTARRHGWDLLGSQNWGRLALWPKPAGSTAFSGKKAARLPLSEATRGTFLANSAGKTAAASEVNRGEGHAISRAGEKHRKCRPHRRVRST